MNTDPRDFSLESRRGRGRGPSAQRSYAAGDLRVSDSDRDQALAELTSNFEAGRLTSEEFDERSGRALTARTGRDLAALVADLPAPPAPSAPLTRPGADLTAAGGQRPARGGWSAPPSWMILACIIVAASILTSAAHRHGVFVAWWVIPLVFLIVRRSRRGSRDS